MNSKFLRGKIAYQKTTICTEWQQVFIPGPINWIIPSIGHLL